MRMNYKRNSMLQKHTYKIAMCCWVLFTTLFYLGVVQFNINPSFNLSESLFAGLVIASLIVHGLQFIRKFSE